jgi:hypothetical protein
MGQYVGHPFTGSLAHESQFFSTLTPQQQALYFKAREEERATLDTFFRLLDAQMKGKTKSVP